MFLQLPLGMGGACSTRIGQHLGANRPLEAKTATRVALSTASRLVIDEAQDVTTLDDI